MSTKAHFTVGEWLVQPEFDRIRRGDREVPLQPQVMDLLAYLAHRAGEVVTAEDLLENLWPGKVVTSSSVYVTVKQLRDALGDNAHRPRYIKTIPKRGYQLIARVSQDKTPEHELTSDEPAAPGMKGARWRVAGLALLALAIGFLALHRADRIFPEPVARNSSVHTLAVMPFKSSGPDQAFATGLQDHLTTRMAGIDALRVIARGSVDRVADAGSASAEAGRALGADIVLGGDIQQSAGQWRIQVRLLQVPDNTLLWGSTFDRVITAADRFAVQSEITSIIAAALQKELQLENNPVAIDLPTANLEAYEQFLLGNRKLVSREISSMRQAVQHLQLAVELDPTFALALAKLGDALELLRWYGDSDPERLKVMAKAHIDRALELDPELGVAHVSLANWLWTDDLARANLEFQAGIRLSPNYAEGHHWYGEFLADAGRLDDAAAQYRMALIHDPLSPVTHLDLGIALERLGRFEEAFEQYQKVLAIDPQYRNMQLIMGSFEITATGSFVNAIPYLQAAIVQGSGEEPGPMDAILTLALADLQVEDLDGASHLLNQVLEREPESLEGLYLQTKLDWMRLAESAPPGNFERLDQRLPAPPAAGRARARVADFLGLLRNHDLANDRPERALRRYQQQFPELASMEGPLVEAVTAQAAVDLALIYRQLGDLARAQALASAALSAIQPLPRRGGWGYRLADVQALAVLGDPELALQKLGAALDEGYREAALYYMKHDPNLASLRETPDFQERLGQLEAETAGQRGEITDRISRGELLSEDALLALWGQSQGKY